MKKAKKRKLDFGESSKDAKHKKKPVKSITEKEDPSSQKEKEKIHNVYRHSIDESGNHTEEKSWPLEPDSIAGATEIESEIVFLVKWKNSAEASLVPSKIAHERCPQLVINFYEKHLNLRSPVSR